MTFFETSRGSCEIIYEDRDVLVLIKPAGLLSQGAGGEKSVLDFAADYTGGEVYPVHRLDRGTEGVMLAAKTSSAAAALSELISLGGIKKEYLAAVNGIPERREDTLKNDLFFDRRRDKSFIVKPGSGRRGVKGASLEYKTVAEGPDICGRSASVLKILLHTGRTHQIRVQMAGMGHPLMGDGKYGGGNCRYPCTLFAFRLTLDGEALCRTALGARELGALAKEGSAVFEHIPKGGIWKLFDIFGESAVQL